MRENPVPSKAHRLFFAKTTSRGPFGFQPSDYWATPLGEAPEAAFDRFLAGGLIQPVPVHVAVDATYTVEQIKPLLKERGLKVGGRKAELIERLRDADPQWWADAGRNIRIFRRTATGQRIADEVYWQIGSDRAAIELRLTELIREGRHEDACDAWQDWNAEQVFPRPSVIAVQEFKEFAEFVLKALPAAEGDRLLVDHLLGTRRYDESSRRTLHAWYYRRDLLDYRRKSFVKGIRVISRGEDGCERAERYAGSYRLSDAPAYPFGPCDYDEDGGCNCYWTPILDDEKDPVWRSPKERHPCAGDHIETPPAPLTMNSLRATAALLGVGEEGIQIAAKNAGLLKEDAAPEDKPGPIIRFLRWLTGE